jgi:hypothetical protein
LDGRTWIPRNQWSAHDTDVNEITQRAGHLFVFAATAVRYVLAGLPQVDPQTSIDFLLGGDPLQDLHDLYYRIVNEAIPDPNTEGRRPYHAHKLAMRVLSTILQLYQPLNTTGLASLVQMDEQTVQSILIPLSAVIHAPDIPEGTIRIVHLSFREFMASRHIQEGRPDLLCGTKDQQHFVVSHLLRIMQSELKFNICNLPTSHLHNVDMPNIEEKIHFCIPKHLRYSCQFWGDHLADTFFDSDIEKLAGEFLFGKFLFWLEVLSLLGMVGYALRALSKFISWAKVRIFMLP